MSEKEEIIISHQVLQVPYQYSAGPITSRFLTSLRDDKKILGIRCEICNRVYVPPRSTCGVCFSELREWVELSGRGRIESFSFVNYSEMTHPYEDIPLIFAIIKLDGADTGIVHLIGEAREEDLEIGKEVEPVFNENRRGHILDIKYFKVLK